MHRDKFLFMSFQDENTTLDLHFKEQKYTDIVSHRMMFEPVHQSME